MLNRSILGGAWIMLLLTNWLTSGLETLSLVLGEHVFLFLCLFVCQLCLVSILLVSLSFYVC